MIQISARCASSRRTRRRSIHVNDEEQGVLLRYGRGGAYALALGKPAHIAAYKRRVAASVTKMRIGLQHAWLEGWLSVADRGTVKKVRTVDGPGFSVDESGRW